MKNRLFVIGCIAIIAVSLFVRFYHLSQPNDVIFDEVYFPVFAQDYLTKTEFFDVHPPLGKLIIAGSIYSLGNNPIGWRFINAVTGMLLLGVIAAFMYDATKRLLPTFLVLLLVAIDPMALVESRVGLINIYLAFFSILGLWQFWRWWQNPSRNLSLLIGLLAFVAAGSVKWIGFGTFAAALAFFFTTRWTRGQQNALRWWHLLLMVCIPILFYLAVFIPDMIMRHGTNAQRWIEYFVWWHQNAFGYHAHLKATHPYGSEWWSWPFSIRPLWLYFKTMPGNRIIGIIEPGNIITWIGGIVAVGWALYAIIRGRGQSYYTFLTYLVFTYLVVYIPWGFIGRVKFIYHYFVPLLIVHLITALALEKLCETKNGRIAATSFLIAGLAFFVYFLPLLMGLTISTDFYRSHLWFKSWI